MDTKLLIDLKTKGDECSFDFEPHLPLYNPLMEFIKEVSCKEKAHTNILADLLNPHGMHNAGSSFLKLFLSSLKISHISPENIDMDSVTIAKERVINVGEKREKLDRAGRSFRRIDILIEGKLHNGETFAIVIENKLNGAQFQEYQLETYRNLVTELVGKPENVIVVCLMKYQDSKDVEADIQLDSKGLSSIIDQCCFANPTLTPMLRPYTQYLMDLDMDDNILQNARCLADDKFSREDLEVIRAFHDAYEKLPEAYESLFEEAIKKPFDNNGINANIQRNKTYPNYCDIWQDEIYRVKATWLSIGFEHDKVRFFLVSNNILAEEVAIKEAVLLGFEKHSYGGGAIWFDYKGLNPQLPFELLYSENEGHPGKPDFERIQSVSMEYLKLLAGTE